MNAGIRDIEFDTQNATAFLNSLCEARPSSPPPRAMLVVAHPDDEVIGAGSRLPWLAHALFVHVTDGAPRDTHDARAAGFATCAEYAAARREELREALALANVSSDQLVPLGIPDRETPYQLSPLVESLVSLMRRFEPELLLTHPYEGGHPDHDSTCFAVHAACEQLRQSGAPAPVILEMAFYHAIDERLVTGEFLTGTDACTIHLSDAEWELKQRMLGCFRTQKFLQHFSYRHESFRVAPRYNFLQAPHPGTLFYELLHWNITGRDWRALARATLAAR